MDAQAQWNQLAGKAKQSWADLTDDELLATKGNTQELIGYLQEKYDESEESVRQRLGLDS